MNREHCEVAILGAGVTGLAAAHALGLEGRSALVFEARDRLGGLLDNFTVQGFRFDHAVHLSFGQEPEVVAVLEQTPFHQLPAESRCFDKGHWLRHPVQNNLHGLPIGDRIALIESFVARPTGQVENYRDWLVQEYGEGIAERYPLRYTRKYWTVPAEALGTRWIGPRMRKAELKEILLGAFSAETPHAYYVKEMRYPDQGGFKSFLSPLLGSLHVRCNHRVVRIDLAAHVVHFEGGAECHYEQLISTLPLPLLVPMLEACPSQVSSHAATLFATSLDLVSVGFADDRIRDLWFYIYDDDIDAARAYSPSVKSRDNVPDGCSSLQFEIYSSPRAPMRKTPAELVENCLYALRKMSIAAPEDVLFTHHKRVPFANVVFDLGMEERRDRVLGWLKEQGILSIGRFGSWDYLWSHQCLAQGLRAPQLLAELGAPLRLAPA
jgi:protoporphyrinogen oxidase